VESDGSIERSLSVGQRDSRNLQPYALFSQMLRVTERTQTTLISAQPDMFTALAAATQGRVHRSAFPIFRVGNGVEMAGFRDWLAVVAA